MSGFLYAKLKGSATAERGKIKKCGKIKKYRGKVKRFKAKLKGIGAKCNCIALGYYLDDASSRTKGNQSAVMYKTFDGNTWSDAKILSDDGTADYYPQVSADSTTAYITWMNLNKKLSTSSNLNDAAKACDISVIKFDSNTMQPSGSAVKLTNNETLDMLPTVYASQTPIVEWISNSNNDILTQTGTNTICFSALNGESWTTPDTYKSYVSKPIIDMAIGNIDDDIALAYTIDNDNNLMITEDVELYTGKLSETPLRLTDNNTSEQSVQYASINGSNVFVWECNGTLEMTDNLQSATTLYGGELVSSDFGIVNNDEMDYVVFSISENNKANLYMSEIEDGFILKSPIQLTALSGYSRNVSATVLNDKYLFAFTRTDTNIEVGNVAENSDLCVYYTGKYHNLEVTELDYSEKEIIPGKKAKMTVRVLNNGLYNESNYKVTITLPNGDKEVVTVNRTIKPGESELVDISVMIPSEMKVQSMFFVSVSPLLGNNLSKSNYSEKVGSVDLQISTEQFNGIITATVDNISCFDTSATLNIRTGDASGNIIKQIPIGNILAGSSKVQTIFLSDYISSLSSETNAYIEVVSNQKEIYVSDNYDYIITNNTSEIAGQIKIPGADKTSVKITVESNGDKIAEVMSTSSMTYFIDGLLSGKYTITFNKTGCTPRRYDVTLECNETILNAELHLKGDVNGDGKITTVDVGLANAHAKGAKILNDYDFEVAEVSEDGIITTVDVGIINAIAKRLKQLN